MTWTGRLKLLFGFVVVLVLAALATYHLNETRGTATSDSAQIMAKTYNVGTPYPGLIVAQKVEAGDDVAQGDALFVIDSAALTRDLSMGTVASAGDATKVDDDGNLVILATTDGTVTDVAAEKGTFVSASDPLATVQRAGTLYVQAEYTLSAKEYARVPQDAVVTIVLPDQTTVTGRVERVDVTTVAGEAQAVLTITGENLDDGARNGLVSSGTPVTAGVALRNDGVVTDISRTVTAYVERTFG